MLDLFTKFADWSIRHLGLSTETHFGASVHFFIEDVSKIFVLIYVLIFLVSLFRSQLSPERVREYLTGKSRWWGYILAVILGVVTPFCSCSSIPLFIGFIAAGIPFGITMAFLISSPLISEIAAILLLGMEGAGPLVAGVYILSGGVIAVLGGYVCDLFHLEKYANYSPATLQRPCCTANGTQSEKLKALIIYAHRFSCDTIKGIGIYILIGLVVGAGMHGYIPAEFFARYLGSENIWAVPFAAIIGAPMYASHAGVVPVVQVLLMKGVPVGTALVVLMSITAISIPELIMLKKVLKWQMLFLFTGFLIVAFIITGYLLNWIM